MYIAILTYSFISWNLGISVGIIAYTVRGGVVVKALRYKPAGRVSIPDGVKGIFQ
jgi:hypothetical protein